MRIKFIYIEFSCLVQYHCCEEEEEELLVEIGKEGTGVVNSTVLLYLFLTHMPHAIIIHKNIFYLYLPL